MATQAINNSVLQNIVTGAMKAGGSNTNMDEVGLANQITAPGGLTVANLFQFITGSAAGAVDDVQKLIDITIANKVPQDSILDKTLDKAPSQVSLLFSGRAALPLIEWVYGGISTGEAVANQLLKTADIVTSTHGTDYSVTQGPGYTFKLGRAETTGVR